MGADQIDRVVEAFHKAVNTLTVGIVGCGLLLIFDKPIINFLYNQRMIRSNNGRD